jgi:hypothetical protein
MQVTAYFSDLSFSFIPEEYAINWSGINKEYLIERFYVIPVSVLRMLVVVLAESNA